MIRAAIVGLGAWGRKLVDSVHGGSERIRFVAAVARTPSKAADYAAARGLPLGGDYAAVLADPAIDAVVLATPHSQHADQILAAARAGKHVYTEKPLALDARSARAAAAACRKAGVVLAVGFNRRFRPAIREVHRLVTSGKLGTVVHVEADFSGPPTGLGGKPGEWRLNPQESPGGAMTGKGIHSTDLMIWMAGPIHEVYAHSGCHVLHDQNRDDTTSLMYRFESGISGLLSTAFSTPELWRFHVFGSKGWAEVRGERHLTTCLAGGAPQTIEYPDNDTLHDALECFADAVEGRGTYPVTPEQAVATVAVLEGMSASLARRRPVRIAPRRRAATKEQHA